VRRRRGLAIAGLAAGIVALAAPGPAAAGIGDPDPTFSGDGKQIGVGGSGRMKDVVVDSQGRIVVAADFNPTPVGDTGDFAVVRYLASGVLDASFGGGDGIVNVDVTGTGVSDDPQGVALDAQGGVIVAGSSTSSPMSNTAVVRLTPAGVPDPAFGGGDGIFFQDFNPAGNDSLDDVAVDPQGRVVATGDLGNAGAANAFTLRLTNQGTLDTSFSAPDGFDSLNVMNMTSSTDFSEGIALDSAGRIVIAGETRILANQENFFAARYLPTGELDGSFTSDAATIPGRSVHDLSTGAPPAQSDGAEGVAIASGDRPVMVGYAQRVTTDGDFAVLRLTSAGARDGSFGAGGAAYVDFGGSEFGEGIAIDGAGRTVVTGVVDIGLNQMPIARLLPSGLLDPAFSGDGKAPVDLGPQFDPGESVTIDRGGRPVAVGAAAQGMGAEWAITRLEGVPRCAGRVPTITGTPGKDKLKGTKAKDVISGGNGRDTISGLGKADTICGEAGGDRLIGGKGNDRILGGAGADTLIGGPGGKDRLKGGKGRDTETQ
jgi:uncharacterized delta-60 repeat protein